MKISRRSALVAVPAILSAAALAGCGIITSVKTGGVTTITIDVARLDKLTQAGTSGGKLLLDNPLFVSAVGMAADAAGIVALSAIAAAIAKIDAQAGGKQVLTYNSNSPPAAVSSLAADFSSLFGDVQTGVTAAGASVGSTVMQVFDAFQTVVALIEAALPSNLVGALPSGAKVMMPEAKALAILGAA